MDTHLYQLAADTVLAAHVAVVLFVLGGLVLILAGNLRGWSWVNLLWFRLIHLTTIGIVVSEAWLGIVCPLTTLEMWLRAQAQVPAYAGSFIEHWLQALLYWQAPPWVFTLAYSAFGLAVAAAWWYFPPRLRVGRKDDEPTQEASP
jgi:polyferredoxin